ARERDRLAVWRPLRLGVVAPNVGELPRRLRARYRCQPERVPGAPDREAAVGGNLDVLAALESAVHGPEEPRLAVGHVGRPDLLLRLVHVARRVGHLALGVGLAAAR